MCSLIIDGVFVDVVHFIRETPLPTSQANKTQRERDSFLFHRESDE